MVDAMTPAMASLDAMVKSMTIDDNHNETATVGDVLRLTADGDDCDTSRVVVELMDELKERCEVLVSGGAGSDDYMDAKDVVTDVEECADQLRRRRVDDSEADIDEPLDGGVDALIDRTVNGLKDIDDSTATDDTIDGSLVDNKRSNGWHRKSAHRKGSAKRPKDIGGSTEKWGESVGIVDEKGCLRRVLAIKELRNYLPLECTNATTDSTIYCSLINDRFPRFFDSTYNYLQRWRMRYNVFADGLLADKHEDCERQTVVHIGELHLYFDLMPQYPNPHYVNNSFYANGKPSERPLDSEAVSRVMAAIDSVRQSRDIHQLRLPVRADRFHNLDAIHAKFEERQQEMVDESRAVHRKGVHNHHNNNRFHGTGGRGGGGAGRGRDGYETSQRGRRESPEHRSFGRHRQQRPELTDNSRESSITAATGRPFERRQHRRAPQHQRQDNHFDAQSVRSSTTGAGRRFSANVRQFSAPNARQRERQFSDERAVGARPMNGRPFGDNRRRPERQHQQSGGDDEHRDVSSSTRPSIMSIEGNGVQRRGRGRGGRGGAGGRDSRDPSDSRYHHQRRDVSATDSDVTFEDTHERNARSKTFYGHNGGASGLGNDTNGGGHRFERSTGAGERAYAVNNGPQSNFQSLFTDCHRRMGAGSDSYSLTVGRGLTSGQAFGGQTSAVDFDSINGNNRRPIVGFPYGFPMNAGARHSAYDSLN